ncbi:hypothetical protein AtubIFM57143_001870 [Aspergillus tubingensis]|nr:hypothetical protein AtubIFM57143_001870 [Aspergillus tubingensis]
METPLHSPPVSCALASAEIVSCLTQIEIDASAIAFVQPLTSATKVLSTGSTPFIAGPFDVDQP